METGEERMCNGSRAATKSVDAVAGVTYHVGTIKPHGLINFFKRIGVLHAPGVPASQCVHCIKDGAVFMLSGVPQEVRDLYGIGDTVTATFKQSSWNEDDQVELATGVRIPFRAFAKRGVTAILGVPARSSNTDDIVANIIATATAGADAELGQASRRESVPVER